MYARVHCSFITNCQAKGSRDMKVDNVKLRYLGRYSYACSTVVSAYQHMFNERLIIPFI